MKALAVFRDEKQIKIIDHATKEQLGPHEVRLAVQDVGICGTDVEIAHFQYGTPPDGEKALIIGHESLSRVVEVGSAVESVAPGDLAVAIVRRPCPHESCVPCRAGHQDFCATGDYTERGIMKRNGFMTEEVIDDERFLVKVPRELRDIAVLTEPLTIAEKALRQLWQVQERLPWSCPAATGAAEEVACHRAVILGAGPVGLLGAMAFRACGFQTFVYSRNDVHSEKARLVEAIGADYFSSADWSLDEFCRHINGFDVVYEATGAAQISFEMLGHLGRNGVFIFTGVPGRRSPIELDAARLMKRMVLENQIVYGTVNAAREDYVEAVRSLARFKELWPEAVEGLITSRHPLTDYAKLLGDQRSGIKNIVSFAN